jgi:hypothetical protein
MRSAISPAVPFPPCFVCGATTTVAAPGSDVRICLLCVPKLGATLGDASAAALDAWFVASDRAQSERASPGTVHTLVVSGDRGESRAPTPPARQGRGSFASELDPSFVDVPTLLDARGGASSDTHLDLAFAYDAMGLVADAIREAACVLRRAPEDLELVRESLGIVFRKGRTRPGALAALARATRDVAS